MLATPGLQFWATPMITGTPGQLEPTPSTYGLLDFEGEPKRGELYVVCRDGSIQSVFEPTRSIGWELIEKDDRFFYRVTQMNHQPKPCLVFFNSRTDDPPAGGRRIGSIVTFERRVDTPQEAEMTEAKDDDVEVCSRAFGPVMAEALAAVNDPEQTYVMAQFARGEIGYAEMRARCG